MKKYIINMVTILVNESQINDYLKGFGNQHESIWFYWANHSNIPSIVVQISEITLLRGEYCLQESSWEVGKALHSIKWFPTEDNLAYKILWKCLVECQTPCLSINSVLVLCTNRRIYLSELKEDQLSGNDQLSEMISLVN